VQVVEFAELEAERLAKVAPPPKTKAEVVVESETEATPEETAETAEADVSEDSQTTEAAEQNSTAGNNGQHASEEGSEERGESAKAPGEVE
jgi:hypothetical protein